MSDVGLMHSHFIFAGEIVTRISGFRAKGDLISVGPANASFAPELAKSGKGGGLNPGAPAGPEMKIVFMEDRRDPEYSLVISQSGIFRRKRSSRLNIYSSAGVGRPELVSIRLRGLRGGVAREGICGYLGTAPEDRY